MDLKYFREGKWTGLRNFWSRVVGSGEREETVQKDFPGYQGRLRPNLQGKPTVGDFRHMELILLTFSLYSLEEWKEFLSLSPAHTVPWLLQTSFLVFQRTLWSRSMLPGWSGHFFWLFHHLFWTKCMPLSSHGYLGSTHPSATYYSWIS